MQAREVLDFWLVEHGPDDWYAGDPEFDRKCAERLADFHAQAARGELWRWRATPEGRLAEIILLDQLSRQLYRGDPRAFATDLMALALAQEVVAQGLDNQLDAHGQLFVYMPFMHAESLPVQDESIRLFEKLGDEFYLPFAIDHRETVLRFGRFPFRNAVLGRASTSDEIAYMAEREGKAY